MCILKKFNTLVNMGDNLLDDMIIKPFNTENETYFTKKEGFSTLIEKFINPFFLVIKYNSQNKNNLEDLNKDNTDDFFMKNINDISRSINNKDKDSTIKSLLKLQFFAEYDSEEKSSRMDKFISTLYSELYTQNDINIIEFNLLKLRLNILEEFSCNLKLRGGDFKELRTRIYDWNKLVENTNKLNIDFDKHIKDVEKELEKVNKQITHVKHVSNKMVTFLEEAAQCYYYGSDCILMKNKEYSSYSISAHKKVEDFHTVFDKNWFHPPTHQGVFFKKKNFKSDDFQSIVSSINKMYSNRTKKNPLFDYILPSFSKCNSFLIPFDKILKELYTNLGFDKDSWERKFKDQSTYLDFLLCKQEKLEKSADISKEKKLNNNNKIESSLNDCKNIERKIFDNFFKSHIEIFYSVKNNKTVCERIQNFIEELKKDCCSYLEHLKRNKRRSNKKIILIEELKGTLSCKDHPINILNKIKDQIKTNESYISKHRSFISKILKKITDFFKKKKSDLRGLSYGAFFCKKAKDNLSDIKKVIDSQSKAARTLCDSPNSALM